jgi:hypothetical protein
MNNSLTKIIISCIIFIALVGSFYIGSFLAEANYFKLGMVAAIILFLFYALFLNKYWIFIALLISALGFRIQPLGPALDPEHIAVLLCLGFILSNFWKKTSPAKSETAVLNTFSWFNRSFIVFTVFLIIHSYITIYYPSPEIVVAFRNLAKQYFYFWAPFAILWTTIRFIRFIPAVKKPHTWIGIIFLLGIAFNIILRAYSSYIVGVGEKDLVTGEMISPSVLYIPVVNLADNVFVLRGLSPLVALFGIAMLTSRNKNLIGKGQNFLWVSLLVLGIVGSVLSMGRATMVITVLLVILCLLIRKHIAAVAIIFLLFVFLIVGARIAYEADKDYVPFGIQRSLAMIPGMDMPEAKGDIDASSEWRWMLATRALDEWKSNSRKFFIGRGVHAFTDRDIAVGKLDGYYGVMDINLRRATTHNIVTDLLLTIGLLGFVSYVNVFYNFVISFIKTLHLANKSENVSYEIIFVSVLFSISMIPAYILGGGGIYNTVVLVFCAALANIAAVAPPAISPLKKS